DVDQAQELAHRLGHFASAFIARAAALGDPDLGPELLLVETESASDLARIEDAFEKLHGALRFVLAGDGARARPGARVEPAPPNTIGTIVDQSVDSRKGASPGRGRRPAAGSLRSSGQGQIAEKRVC